MVNKNKGFTLIELLVVIAIIGILAAVALTSLGAARNKAKDSSAISSLSSARAAAEIYADGNGNSYTGVCADTDVARLIVAAEAQTGFTADCQANTGGTEYALGIELLDTSANHFFCVDSVGKAQKQDTALGTATVCPTL